MTTNSSLDQRKNKNLVIDHRISLQKYALKNYDSWGKGIIVINLLLLEDNSFDESKLINSDFSTVQNFTVHRPISYIPYESFWFKIINLKIKNKYQIDLLTENNLKDKFLIVFIKDDSLEHFSIYSIKTNSVK